MTAAKPPERTPGVTEETATAEVPAASYIDAIVARIGAIVPSRPAEPGDRIVEVRFLASIPAAGYPYDDDDTVIELVGEVESAIQRTGLSYAHLRAGAPQEPPQRDPLAMRAAFDSWYASMPEGWQDGYTNQGCLLVAFTHGWDERMVARAGERAVSGHGTITPPWSPEQVTRLNAFQRAGVMHPFTCGNDACPGVGGMHASLVAAADGWHCPACDYTQLWAHSFMADGSCETHPLTELWGSQDGGTDA